MGVGLQPLEFTECLADSPHFRENLQRHEKELERTSQQIKRLIKEVKDVVQAAKRLGSAQLALATSMEQFEFACIGASMTEDERVIGRSLHHFAHLIRTIEDERERMLGRAHEQIIQPLERFRKEHIGAVKEGKKKFDKKTAKFCQSQERTLSLSTKKPEAVFQEADAAMDMAERDFCQASLEYVFQLQAVQERKKFELVETLLGFVFGWWTFHHTAHDVHADAEPRVRDLQLRIQRTRSNFEEMSKQTESLMKKMMEVRQMHKEEEGAEEGGAGGSRAGYLFLMEKKAFGTTTWSKQYCTYEKSSRQLAMTPYNQINVKTMLGPVNLRDIRPVFSTNSEVGVSEALCVCGARACSEPVERRFCWECVPAERERAPLTLQALGERDRAAWLRARRRRAGRRGLRLRAAARGRHRGARAGGAGAVPRGGRGVQGVAAGGVRGRRPPPARLAARPARVGDQDADVGAQELSARAARAAADARAARAVPERGQVRAARRARGSAGGAGARAAAPRARHAAAGGGAPAQRGRAPGQEPDVGVQPGRVLRAHAAAARARDRGVHPGAQVLQRAGGDAAGPLRGDLRARRRARPAARAHLQRHAPDVPAAGRGARGGAARRALLAAPPAAAAALRRAAAAQRRGPLQQQLGGVGVVAQRVAPPSRAGGGSGDSGGGARAHAVRVPGGERGRAVVRAQPDHHQRGAQRGAGLAAGHAQRAHRARARELCGAATLASRPPSHTDRPNIIS